MTSSETVVRAPVRARGHAPRPRDRPARPGERSQPARRLRPARPGRRGPRRGLAPRRGHPARRGRRAADAAARGAATRGATAVVTLEPCNHTGRTGPCSEALLAAGVARVVVSVRGPEPASPPAVPQRLRAAGVDVETGLLADEGRALLGAWLPSVERGRPFVTLKLATSLDGRVAAADGSSRWITSEVSRHHAHDLRAEVDAIVVGTGTALVDDPSLTARNAAGRAARAAAAARRRRPPRPSRRTPACTVPAASWSTLRTHDPARGRWPRSRRARSGTCSSRAARRSPPRSSRAGLVDEVHAYVAPVLLGSGRPAMADLGVTTHRRRRPPDHPIRHPARSRRPRRRDPSTPTAPRRSTDVHRNRRGDRHRRGHRAPRSRARTRGCASADRSSCPTPTWATRSASPGSV